MWDLHNLPLKRAVVVWLFVFLFGEKLFWERSCDWSISVGVESVAVIAWILCQLLPGRRSIWLGWAINQWKRIRITPFNSGQWYSLIHVSYQAEFDTRSFLWWGWERRSGRLRVETRVRLVNVGHRFSRCNRNYGSHC